MNYFFMLKEKVLNNFHIEKKEGKRDRYWQISWTKKAEWKLQPLWRSCRLNRLQCLNIFEIKKIRKKSKRKKNESWLNGLQYLKQNAQVVILHLYFLSLKEAQIEWIAVFEYFLNKKQNRKKSKRIKNESCRWFEGGVDWMVCSIWSRVPKLWACT